MKQRLKEAIVSQYGKNWETYLEVDGDRIYGWAIEDSMGEVLDREGFTDDELADMYVQESEEATG